MVHRWLKYGTQVVRVLHTGGQSMVHRWLADGTRVVRVWYTGG